MDPELSPSIGSDLNPGGQEMEQTKEGGSQKYFQFFRDTTLYDPPPQIDDQLPHLKLTFKEDSTRIHSRTLSKSRILKNSNRMK